ncbi:rod shape-determining protein MreD [Bacteroides sp.]|uniref:rod shape-determining protein MreD n=1 Tax=Bacteroides sp. TaxID=29523 RepID=UPI001B5E5C54|nr:rod shape-determining protein MreD [Bacteroides sp.]MBP6065977.1 rod shape-determining protein MreD [Bacteroides sp.]MBP6067994.1 rod shape-determining protein MreD [Bacteroides sp.]MBP6937113.1 rod shape-determining protein MreD [Bacteroides sp.]MBP8622497.1 rod shape-determining protein MreD [Bacteroides sp.]MBP9506540.1 rod shape-determining protein MreD [Bacteroides sp.]
MMINYLHKTGWFVGLMLLQVLLLNHIHIAGYATPFLYVYFILKFASNTSRNELMLWGFFLGFFIDIFSNTPGMNAAATTFMAFSLPYLLRLFMPRDLLDGIVPSFKSMGVFPFFKYMLAAVFVHQCTLLTIEYFSFSSIPQLLLRVVVSTLFTCTCIMAVEGVRR